MGRAQPLERRASNCSSYTSYFFIQLVSNQIFFYLFKHSMEICLTFPSKLFFLFFITLLRSTVGTTVFFFILAKRERLSADFNFDYQL